MATTCTGGAPSPHQSASASPKAASSTSLISARYTPSAANSRAAWAAGSVTVSVRAAPTVLASGRPAGSTAAPGASMVCQSGSSPARRAASACKCAVQARNGRPGTGSATASGSSAAHSAAKSSSRMRQLTPSTAK